jgi:hypothetical protein
VSWFYEVRNSKNALVASAEGFASEKEALKAARKRARDLRALGSLGPGVVGTIRIGHNSEKTPMR